MNEEIVTVQRQFKDILEIISMLQKQINGLTNILEKHQEALQILGKMTPLQ